MTRRSGSARPSELADGPRRAIDEVGPSDASGSASTPAMDAKVRAPSPGRGPLDDDWTLASPVPTDPGRDDRSPSGSEDRRPDESRIGDPSVTALELGRMGNLLATRHLLALLAHRRHDKPRREVIEEVATLVLALEDGPYARRLLLQMAEVGRIIDIYPLEVMTRIVERAPGALPRIAMGPVVRNLAELEANPWPVGEIIPLKVPLNLRLKAFALEGGGTPGYVLAPGPPASYALELGSPGRHTLLLRGEVRKDSMIERLTVRVE